MFILMSIKILCNKRYELEFFVFSKISMIYLLYYVDSKTKIAKRK